MGSNSKVDSLTEEEYNFIVAVIEDSNYEFAISEDEEYYLMTDWEGEGFFLPSVTIMHSVSSSQKQAEVEYIESLVSEYDWFNHKGIDTIDSDSSGDLAHAYFHNESIDEDTLEAVDDLRD